MTQHINPAVVSGSLTAQGQYVGPYKFRGEKGDIRQNTQRISIRGIFTGTVEILVCDPGVDQTVATNQVVIASYTAPTSQVFEAGGACDVYFYSSAWTSGTAVCSVYY
jgi:hypothetical protein